MTDSPNQGGFALRYINVLFCPAFVLIPLSPSVSGREVGKIVAVFIFGYLIVFAFTAYLTRGLQYLFGTSKRGMTERGDELGGPHEDIPLATIHELSGPPTPGESNVPTPSESIPPTPGESVTTSMVPLLDSNDLANELQEPLRAQDPASITGTGGPPTHEHVPGSTSWMYRQEGLPLNRAQEWATIVNARIDVYTYMMILFLIGLPIYLATNYAMPAQLSLNVLAYFLALKLPPNWRRFLHPALVASVVTICGIYILAMCRGDDFHDGLLAYQTKTKYQQLFSGKTDLPKPGAGDFLSSILDVSIVALALPMYQYRQELKRSFFPIIIPTISIAIASLFGYPYLCHAIGISPGRSLSFPSRSLTLALATPATQNLGGDLSLVAVLCILSGIMGVLIGPQLLDLLKIPQDDYITRGVTLGGNSSALATALLLVTDPRAAAFSSLAMGLFGTITVAMTSVPSLADVIARLAGK
ncbi:hypothetical protein Vi05172_g11265 [Venturia inaequalis]|nr:hypothetical protein Vi05172_g11265 [Venturia inaequalis]